MSDIKLFRADKAKAQEVDVIPTELEKHVQMLIERNLETFFNIRLIESEYSTGKKHKGRIDTLGIDENNCPVIIEYKRHMNENVINQGLYYLDWLLDHKAEFEKVTHKKLGKNVDVDWSSPRLLCIAGDFTKYDEYAIEQINRNIELIRFRRYDGGLMLFELASTSEGDNTLPIKGVKEPKHTYKHMKDLMKNSDKSILEVYEVMDSYITSLGDDVQKKELKFYFAYRRMRNFACVEVHKKHILAYLKLNPDKFPNLPPNSRDVRGIGHYGTGDLEFRIETMDDLTLVKPYMEKAYELS